MLLVAGSNAKIHATDARKLHNWHFCRKSITLRLAQSGTLIDVSKHAFLTYFRCYPSSIAKREA